MALKSMGQLEFDVAAAEVLKAKADLAAEAVASKGSGDAPELMAGMSGRATITPPP